MCNYVFPKDVVVSELAKNLMTNLLVKGPGDRYRPEQILSHKFFNGYIPE
jgi:hypothetical protein